MAKGGTYEWTIIRKLTAAFKPFGIHPDDAYRSRGSGAHDQPGDIALASKFAKMFPVLVECKHYKRVKYQLGRRIDNQDKTFRLSAWWQQVKREQKQNKNRFAILIFRQNNCPDLVAIKIKHFIELTGKRPVWEMFSWSMFTSWGDESIVICPFDEWLAMCVNKVKRLRIIHKKSKLRRGK